VTARTTRSLDERYLDFNASTRAIFAAHPQLEPLRQFVFKDLLIRRRAEGVWATAKHWLRPLYRRAGTRRAPRADVLVWVESGREVIGDALVPVYEASVRRGASVVLISDGGPSSLQETALPFEYPAAARAPQWAVEVWDALSTCEPALRQRSLRRSFVHACAMVQTMYDEIERVLETVGPRTVVSASHQLRGGAALDVAARRHGVTSVLLQHGILQPFYTPLVADLMLTWGPTSDDILGALGVSRARLLATGSPRHDAMRPSESREARARLVRGLGLPDRPTLVFFSNGNDMVRNGPGPAACVDWLEAAAAASVNDVNVVVRLHPNEDGSLYRRCPHVTLTRGDPDLGTTLDGCDRVASLCSTVLYDGLLYRKPIWHFHADGWPDLADNWKRGLALRVSSGAQLRELVGGMSAGDEGHRVDDRLVARVFANHGRATQVVADAIVSRSSVAGARVIRDRRHAGVTGP
jgi:hypothetical protein